MTENTLLFAPNLPTESLANYLRKVRPHLCIGPNTEPSEYGLKEQKPSDADIETVEDYRMNSTKEAFLKDMPQTGWVKLGIDQWEVQNSFFWPPGEPS